MKDPIVKLALIVFILSGFLGYAIFNCGSDKKPKQEQSSKKKQVSLYSCGEYSKANESCDDWDESEPAK